MTDRVSDIAEQEAAPAATSLLEDAKSIWLELVGLLHDRLQIAALETKLAGERLAAIVAMSVIVAVLAVSTWLGLNGAAILWLIDMGLMPSIALLVGVLFNVILAVLFFLTIQRERQKLGWPATLRSLQPMERKGVNGENP
ncbi:MAG: phage holin family protein [Sulfuriferula sp.]